MISVSHYVPSDYENDKQTNQDTSTPIEAIDKDREREKKQRAT